MLSNYKLEKYYILGNKKIKKSILEPFDELALDFLSDISKQIFNSGKLKRYPDLISFAFWCRNRNLIKKKNLFNKNYIKKNLGIIYHVPPSNVPISLAYSFAFGLLSGNSNIVRVSNPDLENIKELLKIIKIVIRKKIFSEIFKSNLFLSFKRDELISLDISKKVDGRIIWGGDNTIKEFKKMDTKISCRDIYFYDKYSICIIDLKKINFKSSIKKIVEKFYNDTFIIDQNACSSPHLIFWKNYDIKKINNFWNELNHYISLRYKTTKELYLLKYFKLNEILLKSKIIVKRLKLKHLNVYKLKKIDESIVDLRGYSGVFFEYKMNNLNLLNRIYSRKFQTVTYYGIEKKKLVNFIKKNNLNGIDRIVPLGKAIDLDIVWDGLDIVENLTRIIDIT